MRRAAFTLLELLIVLALIVAMIGLGYPTFQRRFARSEFKNGVVELQIDLHRTRLLAMRTGTPYLFRYVPGSGVYEIAPIETLQETIYRRNGEEENFGVDALGGSLATNGFTGNIGANSSVGGAASFGTDVGTSNFSDDLFSPENVAADLAAARGFSNGLASDAVVSNVLGGGLETPSFAVASDGTTDFSTSGANFGADPSLGNGLNASNSSNSSTLRDLNSDEKVFAKENLIAWRVNLDGAIFRKKLSGDVVFTFSRISKSTPTNLNERRPGGLATSGSSASDADLGENLGSQLTGSLTRLPSSSTSSGVSDAENGGKNSNVSGSLNEFNGWNGLEEAAPTSVWSEPIVFYPNGRTSTAVLGLASVGDYSFYSEIAIRGMTGVARISSISGLPPGVDPTTSALTQEELFRLSNPNAPRNGDPNAASTSTDPLSGLSGGSLGDVSTGDESFDFGGSGGNGKNGETGRNGALKTQDELDSGGAL